MLLRFDIEWYQVLQGCWVPNHALGVSLCLSQQYGANLNKDTKLQNNKYTKYSLTADQWLFYIISHL